MNNNKIKNVLDRFPELGHVYSDGEEVYLTPREGAIKISRKEALKPPVKSKPIAPEGSGVLETKKDKPPKTDK